jgi:hypothetical protein
MVQNIGIRLEPVLVLYFLSDIAAIKDLGYFLLVDESSSVNARFLAALLRIKY